MIREEAIKAIRNRLPEYVESITQKSKEKNKYICPLCKSGTGPKKTAAFSVKGEGWHCFSCDTKGDIFDLYGIVNGISDFNEQFKGLCQLYGIEPEEQKPTTKTFDREHIYRDENDIIVAKKKIYRFSDGGKTAIWERYESGEYKAGLKGIEPPLYHLSRVVKELETVYITEGEKDTETVEKMGYTATTIPNKKWLLQHKIPLQNKDVVIIRDIDDAGKKQADTTAAELLEVAKSVKIIDPATMCEGLPANGDISDVVGLIGLDKTKEALIKAVSDTSIISQDEVSVNPKYLAKSANEFGEDTTKFVWYPYIPFDEYTVMMADGGTGKTMLCCRIASDISRGECMPSTIMDKPAPANVLIISAEDRGELLKKRLIACGADLDKIYILDCMGSEGMNFTEGYNDFMETVKRYTPALVIIDPWHAFLGADVDINRVNAVRPVFQRLANMAKSCNCGMILVSHVNKRAQGENANNAATGSTDFINAARSAMRVIFSDEADEKDVRIVVHTKSNYAEAGKSLRFRITEDSGCEWDGYSDITRQTLEEAARLRKTPKGVLNQQAEQEEENFALIEAIKEKAQSGKIINISYDEMKDLYGKYIFGGNLPVKALKRIADTLKKDEIALVYNKTVRYQDRTRNGFGIQKA